MEEDALAKKLMDHMDTVIVIDEVPAPPVPNRASVNKDSPFFTPETAKLGIRFNGVEQRKVVEYCVSEGWIMRYKEDWKGRPVNNGTDYVLGPKIKGTVEAYWKS